MKQAANSVIKIAVNSTVGNFVPNRIATLLIEMQFFADGSKGMGRQLAIEGGN